jgi:methylthioribose-1-phosphate isomerase
VAIGLQRAAGDAIGSALGIVPSPEAAAPVAHAPGASPAPLVDAPVVGDPPAAGVVQHYRVDGEVLWIADHAADTRSAAWIRCATLADLTAAMRARRVFGAPLLGELSAFGLWLVVLGLRGATPQATRTRIRTSGAVLRGACGTVTTIDWALARMVAAWDDAVAITTEASELERAMLVAATDTAARLRAEASSQGSVGADAMPATTGRPFGLLTLGSSGYPADPAGGGAPGIAATLVSRGRPVRGWILETRPLETEARATAFALAAAGVHTSVVADGSAGWLLATGSVDAIVVGADRIAPDGSVTAIIGTYGLAALARQHGVPCYVVATRSTIDHETRDAGWTGLDAEPTTAVDPRDPASAVLATRIGARGPLQDITPPDLIDGILTGSGVLRAPFDDAIARSVAADEASPG